MLTHVMSLCWMCFFRPSDPKITMWIPVESENLHDIRRSYTGSTGPMQEIPYGRLYGSRSNFR